MGYPMMEFYTALTFGSVVPIYNAVKNRPYQAALPLSLTLGVSGFFFAKFLRGWREQRIIQRDLIVMDYIRQHPEDFPELELKPQKYKDVLLPWFPIRHS